MANPEDPLFKPPVCLHFFFFRCLGGLAERSISPDTLVLAHHFCAAHLSNDGRLRPWHFDRRWSKSMVDGLGCVKPFVFKGMLQKKSRCGSMFWLNKDARMLRVLQASSWIATYQILELLSRFT